MVLLSLRDCRQFPRCPWLPERSLPGPQPSGVARPGNTSVAHSARDRMIQSSWLRKYISRCSRNADGKNCRARSQLWLGTSPTLMCVLGGVLLSRTLAGAVPSALSGLASGFGMGAGRFPVAVTTETSGMGSACVGFGCVVAVAARLRLAWVWCAVCVGWVGCGPYSGRFAFTAVFPVTLTYRPCGGRVGGGCCLCRPISTSQLPTVAGLPLLAYQPSSLLGAYQEGQVLLVETLS